MRERSAYICAEIFLHIFSLQKNFKPMKRVTVESTVNQNIQKVWEFWTSPEHIVNWNFATPEWHCPSAEHDLKVGGKLKYHMAAKDGSISFDS